MIKAENDRRIRAAAWTEAAGSDGGTGRDSREEKQMTGTTTLQTRAIWQITERLRDAKDIAVALAGCLEIITQVMECEAGSVWLLSKRSGRLSAVSYFGAVDISGISVAGGQGIVGSVTRSGEPVIVADASKDERFTRSVDEETGFITKSMICVPLKNEYETIGCVELINKRSGVPYTEEDLALCEQMASLAAVAIEEKGFTYEPDQDKRVIISLRGVTKDYPSGDGVSHVLKGIDLDIYENEFVVVFGESGCGKTTLMNIVGGMDSLTDGTLLIDGKDFSHPSGPELTSYRRNEIGYIFQAYHLMPNLSAIENLEFIAEISKAPLPPAEALELVGLRTRANNFPSQMSGGQQQRVSIARALVKQPRLILADEPTAALDYQTSIEVLGVIENIMKAQNTTVMMITHNPEIAKMADRVIRLSNGKVASIRRNMKPLPAKELSW